MLVPDSDLHVTYSGVGVCLQTLQTVSVCMKEKKTKRLAVEQQLIVLQQKTLDAVVQLLDVEKSRLEIERETLAVKQIKLVTKALVQDESGNWVWVKVSKRNKLWKGGKVKISFTIQSRLHLAAEAFLSLLFNCVHTELALAIVVLSLASAGSKQKCAHFEASMKLGMDKL